MTAPGKPHDMRYNVRREWCGRPEPRHVARFCGDWIGQTLDRNDALWLVAEHQRMRASARQSGTRR